MKISFNPPNSNKNILDLIKNNKDIIFDLKGHSIFARGVEFKGTDTNTWRPVVDNLTSDSTTSSLSAKQGKVLKALIDGKSNSDHNHDGRYVRYYAVTTLDCNNLAAGLTAARISATNAAHTNHSAYLYISDVETPFQIQIPDSSIPYIYKRYYGSGKWSGWFKLNAGYADSAGSVAWANVTGKPSSYTPSAHTHAWNSLTHSSTTENQAILTNGKANGWKLQTLNIARWDNAANNAHSHANKSVLDGITSALVNSWNTAYNFVSNITGTDTDKVINKWEEIVNFLAGITEDNKLNTLLNSKLSVYELADNTNVGTIKNNGIYYSTTDASSRTLINSPFNTGFAFINMTSYDGGDDLGRSRLAFNAFGEIKVSDDRDQANTAETWYNVLTSKNSGINGSTIKLNGTSITVYSSGTADGRYVKKSGDTMQGVLTIDTTNFGALTIKRNDDTNGASIQFRGKSSVYGYIGLNNSTKDKQFLRWSSDTSRIYTILDTSSTYISNGKGVINGTTITQVDNATNSTNSTNARKLVNWYSARPTSLNAQFGDGSLRIFYATSSTTEGKPAEDSHILHLAWDNTGGFDAQLAVHARSGKVSTRAQNGGTWQPWKTLAFADEIPTSLKNPYSFNVFGVVYDGSAAKTVTTSNFISQVNEGTSTITDGTMLITSYATNSGFADTNSVNVPYKRKAIHLWEYIKTKTDSLYATKGHNHDERYVRAFGTSNDNIDSDWGQSFKTFDPIPLGTPPEENPNISLLSIGEYFIRRKQLAFMWDNDNIYYRRHIDSGFTNWRRLAFADEIPTYAASAGNADTLDGEHASSFVRAGYYESNDLNKLDTYSFIRSVNSNVSSTSPKGNTGWYNVIQLVHRNGASDGPSCIGQIALGMTTNTNDMFFRGKRTDPWKTVIHSGNIGSQSVNSAQYLRSLGNQNCQTGRTQAYGDVYTYNTITDDPGSPTTYSSVIGFGRGTEGTVEIAGGWCNTHLYWRSLKNCCEDWYPWRVVLDSSNYIAFINNYYWANVKISASSSTTTSPTVLNLTATNSIRMGDILLEHTNEINNSANDTIYLNRRNSGDVSLCVGGGMVGIGTIHPSQELYVQGYTHTKGFGISVWYLSLAFSLPNISPGDGHTYKCFEISRLTKVSCIIADKVPMSPERGVLLNFKVGFDGQIVLLKDLETYGYGNGEFWVMPSQCNIINSYDNNICIQMNQVSNRYNDGRSRFFMYSSRYLAWIEFL